MTNILTKIFRKLKIDLHINYSLRRKVGQKKMVIPIIKGIGYSNLVPQEGWMETVLSKLLLTESQGCFCDVGANVGQTMLLFLEEGKDHLNYIGFEPNPVCCFYLEELISRNEILNAEIYPVGISDKTGIETLSFYSESKEDSSASIIKNFRSHSNRKRNIPVISKDIISQIFSTKQIVILKIDVEGAELHVLQAFENIIQRDKPFIICEVLPVYDKRNVERFKRQKLMENLLVKLNYRMQRIHNDGSLEDISEIGIHADLSFSNYLFFHNGYLH